MKWMLHSFFLPFCDLYQSEYFSKKGLPDYPALSPVKHIIREEMSHYFKNNNGVLCMDK